MRRRMILIGVLIAVALVLAAPSAFAGGAVQGTAWDPNATWLGEIRYLGNRAGYHFWFTPTESGYLYEADHSYHNVYKFSVDDPDEWCTATVPNRAPYNIVAPVGETVYFKVFDTTTDMQVCP